MCPPWHKTGHGVSFLGIVDLSSNIITGEVKAGGLEVQGHPWHTASLRKSGATGGTKATTLSSISFVLSVP